MTSSLGAESLHQKLSKDAETNLLENLKVHIPLSKCISWKHHERRVDLRNEALIICSVLGYFLIFPSAKQNVASNIFITPIANGYIFLFGRFTLRWNYHNEILRSATDILWRLWVEIIFHTSLPPLRQDCYLKSICGQSFPPKIIVFKLFWTDFFIFSFCARSHCIHMVWAEAPKALSLRRAWR